MRSDELEVFKSPACPAAGERAQNVVVAEGLRLRTGGSRTGIVAGLDLVTTATRTRPRVVRGFNSGLRN